MRLVLAIAVMLLTLTVGVTPSYADGDVKQGERKFRLSCQACHTVEQGGRQKVGPNLFGTFGAIAGKRDFKFERRHSAAIKESGIVWDTQTLDAFLENPQQLIPGTRMTFPGFRKKSDRDNVIAYLKSVTQ